MRLFVGLRPPPSVDEELAHARSILGTGALRDALRLTPPRQWHVTLRFLGEVDAARAPDLASALGAALTNRTTFELCLAEPGCFPGADRPRVIWMGLGGDLVALMAAQAAVDAACVAFAEAREETTFHPHVTLARVREARPRPRALVEEALRRMPRNPRTPWIVEAVRLVRSELRPEGAHYVTVAEIPLARTR